MMAAEEILDYAPAPRHGKSWMVVAPVALTLLLILGFGLASFCIAAAGFVVLICMKRFRLFSAVILVLMLLLPGYSFARGVIEYQAGTARHETFGLMGGGYHNPDANTRCYYLSHGCIVTGNEWMTSGAHNLGLSLMTHWFGPMRGTYDGPYPSIADVNTAVATACPVDLTDFARDTITIGKDTITLAPGYGSRLLAQFKSGPASAPGDPVMTKDYGPVTCCTISTRCVVVSVPTQLIDGFSAGFPMNGRVEILIDRTVGKPFAYYRDHAQDFFATVGYR